MKKLLMLLPVLAILGCRTPQEVQGSINGQWMDRNFDEFVLERGAPRRRGHKLSNGDMVYTWSSAKTYSAPNETITAMQRNNVVPARSGRIAHFCRLQIVTNPENIIQEITVLEDTVGLNHGSSRCWQLFNK
jgi:hypothetical protein